MKEKDAIPTVCVDASAWQVARGPPERGHRAGRAQGAGKWRPRVVGRYKNGLKNPPLT